MSRNSNDNRYWDGDFEPESWDRAVERVQSLGYFASSFSTCIRHLRNSQRSAAAAHGPVVDGKLDPVGRHLVQRFMGSPTIKAHLYFLSLTHHEDMLKDKRTISSNDLIDLYTADQMAAVLALIYLFRVIKNKSNKEEWTQLSKALQDVVDVGSFISSKVHGLDLADGMLLPVLRYLALCTCMPLDLKKFQSYRRSILKERRGFNLRFELDTFGCSHVQIAALLLERLGFGARYAEDFKTALCTSPEKRIPFSANRLRMVVLLTDSLYLNVEQPGIAGEEEFEMSEQAFKDLAENTAQILTSGSRHSWLLRGRLDIAPDVAPQLYAEADLIRYRRLGDRLQGLKLETKLSDALKAAGDRPPRAAGQKSTLTKPQNGDIESQSKAARIEKQPESDLENAGQLPEHLRGHFTDEEWQGLQEEIQELLED